MRDGDAEMYVGFGVILVVVVGVALYCGAPYIARWAPPAWEVHCTDGAGAVLFDGPAYTADPPSGNDLGRVDYWTIQTAQKEWVYVTGSCIKRPLREAE